jgi:hypothetical protein
MDRQDIWDDVEQEHGSQGFFEVIKSLEIPEFFETAEDQAAYRENRAQLTQNVWRMLTAVRRDEALREKLFTLASTPINCADAGAQTFNSMGVETLVHEANLSATPQERELKLITLARQKSRLQQVNKIAQALVKERIKPVSEGGAGLRLTTDMAGGVPGSVDEVEVYTACQTGLKTRLDLPWLSDHMTYRHTADVDSATLDQAYATVMDLEYGDGLVNQLIEQDFWSDYLLETHPRAFQENQCIHEGSTGPVDDLRAAQKDWVLFQKEPAESRTEARTAQLRQQLIALADNLGVPHSAVFSGKEMTDADYLRIFNDSFSDEKELSRRLTRAALKKAGL